MNKLLSVLLIIVIIPLLTKGSKKPNLVLVFPDQWRGQALGFLGEEKVKTPVLDQFAREAVYFSNAVSNYPVCSPFRAMLMSGQYPHTNTVVANCTSESAKINCQLPEHTRCWSDILKENGYSTGYIGKWHLDTPHEPWIPTSNNVGEPKWNEWCPPSRRHGFGFWHAYGTYDQHLRPMYWDTDATRDEFKYYDEWGPEHEANLAVEYISDKTGKFRAPGKPFALVVSINPPHTGYNLVPQKYKDIYKNIPVEELATRPNIPAADTRWGKHYRDNIKNYYACITGVDEQFGKILDALKNNGLEENTLVVFMSDHGDCLGIHDEVTKNNWYEESMRIPLLIRFPSKLKSHTDNIMLSVPDLYPTLLGLIGLKKAIPNEVEGTDYSKYLTTGKGMKPTSQWYMRVDNLEPEFGLRGVRNERYTFVADQKKNGKTEYYLFDREKDPYQMENIYLKEEKTVHELETELRKWLNKFKDPWIKHLREK